VNNPFQGLGQLQCLPSEPVKAEPKTVIHRINAKAPRRTEKPVKKVDTGAAPRSAARTRKSRFTATPNPWGLSAAECAVMGKLIEGCTNKEIAAALYVCPKTVEAHMHNIRTAMGTSKTFMAALAWDRFLRPATPHPAETAQPLAGNGDSQ